MLRIYIVAIYDSIKKNRTLLLSIVNIYISKFSALPIFILHILLFVILQFFRFFYQLPTVLLIFKRNLSKEI